MSKRIRLFSEVDVVVYMVLAEAVNALASRAVAEFQIGIIRVRAAAYGAFTRIAFSLLLIVNLPRGALEIYRTLPLRAGTGRGRTEERVSAKEEVVEYCDERQEAHHALTAAQALENGVDEVERVNYGQPFYLYRDEVEEQHTVVREERGKSEEH